jgi:hypothetical protein
MDSWLQNLHRCFSFSSLESKLHCSGCRGWRHHSLAEAWQGSTVSSAPAVLHDLAVCTAEAVAQAYLGEVCRVLPIFQCCSMMCCCPGNVLTTCSVAASLGTICGLRTEV